jgi:hypothetical protein
VSGRGVEHCKAIAAALGQPALAERIKAVCERRVRYGYRRVHVRVKRKGRYVNHRRVHRLYNELGMQLRNKPPKRRVEARLREGRREATQAGEIRAMDFVRDPLATGRKPRELTIVDTWSRFGEVLVSLDQRRFVRYGPIQPEPLQAVPLAFQSSRSTQDRQSGLKIASALAA